MVSYGVNLTTTAVTAQNKQNIKSSNNTEFNGTATIIKFCDWNDQGLLPDINSAHPTLTGYLLTDIDVEEQPGSICKAELTYTCQFYNLPSTTLVEETSTLDVPIQGHPSFSTWVAAGYWDATNNVFNSSAPYDLQGVTSFKVGSMTVTKTEYFDSKPSSRFADIGTYESPSSDFATAVDWLIIGSTRLLQGAFWTRVTIYEFASGGWSTNIYSAAS